MSALPVIDLSDEEGKNIKHDLKKALHDYGCFYIVGHGISAAQICALRSASKKFFALPQEQKESVSMRHSPHFRGYNHAGQERTLGRPDWREQMDIGPEYPVLSFYTKSTPWYGLQGPNQWPETLPEFQETITRWQNTARAVLQVVLKKILRVLGLEKRFSELQGADSYQLLKIIHYPGVSEEKGRQGVGCHTDGDLLTLIQQDGEGGLEVQLKSGEWLSVPPKKGALVVNIGELLTVISCGACRAAPHRVVSPIEGAARFSSAFFLGAPLDFPIPSLVRMHSEDTVFAACAGGRTLQGRLRSHPDVARRYYAEWI